MMLVAQELRVALLTTHVALSAVPALISRERVAAVANIVHDALTARFGIAEPTICVCGLNPHAGERGHLGHEEQASIIPALADLRSRGWRFDGPVPADTAFAARNRKGYDAFIAMYHDQGLAPLKALAFGSAVNITLGLPIIRTSVDHGTALDLAATGNISAGSLAEALQHAENLAGHQA